VERLVKRFEELVAWQKAIDLACEIDLFCRTVPFSRDFALVDQIRRAAHSVSSNIAEGFERCSRAEFRKYLSYAKGSSGELRSQLHLALRLGYLDAEDHDRTVRLSEEVSGKIGKLRASIKVKKAPSP
jgi:four helix bundle protein